MGEYDYSKLRGKIRELGMTLKEFACAIGVSEATLNSRLKNESAFRQDEIAKATSSLHIPACDIPIYFFSHGTLEI